MESFLIKGGVPLEGDVHISGAKNAVLPLMAAALLTTEECVIRKVPNLSDVHFMGMILESLGAEFSFKEGEVRIRARKLKGLGDYDLIRKMRGSICILGPLLARLKKAQVSLPGGCVIGARPIDLHLKGLRALGTKFQIDSGYIIGTAQKLRGEEIFLGGRNGPTVLGTMNVMMAASLAEGVTIIHGAACEPEVVDLAEFLSGMGARITGAGSPTLAITGVNKLQGTDHEVIPDRIEAATFIIGAALTGGDIRIHGARLDHLRAVIDKLEDVGVKVEREGEVVKVKRRKKLSPADITTQPYAGFPTDVQAQMMVLLTQAQGISILTERIFESRFMHVSELARLGADISIEGPSAIIKGPSRFSGAPVMASDLRASAALVLAGLVAEGLTQVKRIYHIDRGYERMDEKLRALGAHVERVREE